MDNQGFNYRTKINIVLLILVIYTLYIAKDFLLYVGVGLSIIAIIGLGGYVVFHVLIWRENYLTKKEEREKIGREIVTTNDGKVIVRDNNPHSTWRQIHLNPNPYVNGKYEEATEAQIRVFNAVMARRKEDRLPLLIEGQATEQQRTIFNIVDTGVHFALFGPTDAGKTTLANHIIDYLRANKTLACDPHAKFNTWSNRCQILQSYDDISHTIERVFLEMSSRYDNGIAGDTILLAIDEWPAIIEERPDCERWIARISREGRKVGVRLLLLSQSDQIGEIGLSIALRNNFIKIELTPELTQQNQAIIRHWDKSTELITLAGLYQRQMSIEERIIDEWARVDTTNFDQAIKTVVSRVYSSDGGNQRQRVREVVSEHISST